VHNCTTYSKGATRRTQIVFVTGEAGIGKTSLVETFLATGQQTPVDLAGDSALSSMGRGKPSAAVRSV